MAKLFISPILIVGLLSPLATKAEVYDALCDVSKSTSTQDDSGIEVNNCKITLSEEGFSGPIPFKEDPPGQAKHPYAMTKIANESMFNYARIPSTTGLRFFTAYGPWGRPDMALYKFVDNIINETEIEVYNDGNMSRDFTYIDDIVDGVIIALESMEHGKNEIYNIGYGERVQLMDFVREIEKNLDREANIRYSPMHPADNQDTWSDTTKLQALGYKPKVSMQEGVANFVEWYKTYHKVN